MSGSFLAKTRVEIRWLRLKRLLGGGILPGKLNRSSCAVEFSVSEILSLPLILRVWLHVEQLATGSTC